MYVIKYTSGWHGMRGQGLKYVPVFIFLLIRASSRPNLLNAKARKSSPRYPVSSHDRRCWPGARRRHEQVPAFAVDNYSTPREAGIYKPSPASPGQGIQRNMSLGALRCWEEQSDEDTLENFESL